MLATALVAPLSALFSLFVCQFPKNPCQISLLRDMQTRIPGFFLQIHTSLRSWRLLITFVLVECFNIPELTLLYREEIQCRTVMFLVASDGLLVNLGPTRTAI